MIGFLVVFALARVAPVILQSRSLPSFLDQGGLLALLGPLIVAALVFIVGARKSTLRIDEEGVFLTSKRSSWRYGWCEIERAVEVDGGVRLILKGRSEVQNRFNLIPAGFGLRSAELMTLIAWGVASRGFISTTITHAEGDDLKRLTSRGMRIIAGLILIVFGGAFIAGSALALSAAKDEIRLQKSGARATASVSRVFEGACSNAHCDLFADYSFVAPDPRSGGARAFAGSARIGRSDDPRDPVVAFVKTNQALPVAYDPAKPTFSRPNFKDELFVGDHWLTAAWNIAVMFVVLAVSAMGFGAILGSRLVMRERIKKSRR